MSKINRSCAGEDELLAITEFLAVWPTNA